MQEPVQYVAPLGQGEQQNIGRRDMLGLALMLPLGLGLGLGLRLGLELAETLASGHAPFHTAIPPLHSHTQSLLSNVWTPIF